MQSLWTGKRRKVSDGWSKTADETWPDDSGRA